MPKDNFEELPMTHIERLDLEQFRHEQKLELARADADRELAREKQRTKQRRTEVWKWVGIAFAFAAVAIVFIYATLIDTEPQSPEDYKTSEAYREERCIDTGGGWVSADILYGSDHGLCVYPGKTVNE